MPHVSSGGSAHPNADAVREQLTRVLNSEPFRQSQRRQRFLKYLVDEVLAGRGDRLKGYAIAIAVFDRSSDFDPAVDPLVRVEAGRLRDKLREYYETEGQTDPIRIELPKGTYTPQIELRQEATSSSLLDAVALPAAASQKWDEQTLGPRGQLPPAWRSKLNGPLSLGLLAAGLLLLAAGSLWGVRVWNAHSPLTDLPSIAVLPFDNIGHEVTWQRFADGITDDIITDLSHSKNLSVIARNSTEVYKDRPADIRQIGRDLDVKYVLEGSIQPDSERIRVNAQLIEAATGRHVWSERYERDAGDLFEVQNELTQRIAATLVAYQGAIAEAERRLIRRKPPASLTAYDTYLLGMEAKHKVTKEGLFEAERLFWKAIAIDPQLARAYCGLATVQYYLIDLGLAPSVEDAVRKMSEAAERAVAFDPDDGLSHQVLGMAYGYQGKLEQSLAELNRAEALAPSDADLLLVVAWSLPQFGEAQRAVGLAERSLKLNPNYPDWYNQGLSVIYLFAEQYDKALKYRSLVKQPLATDYAYLAVAHAYLGHASEAAAAAANAVLLDPAWNAERYLSEAGGYSEKQAELFVEGARKAGLSDCMTSAKLKDEHNFIRVRSCDRKRARMAG